MAVHKELRIVEIGDEDRPSIVHFISNRWGSSVSVSRGQMHDTADLPGFLCRDKGEIIGLVTYHIEDDDCEIVTLNSEWNERGLGTELLNLVIEKAKEKGCTRVWLITTNDNTHAIRFYQRRGFEWVGFHKDAMTESRKLKPEIPALGNDDIPIKHEIEFEYRLPEKKG